VDAGQNDAGNLLPFDPKPTLERIDSLKWDRDGRYWIDPEGKETCCWVDRIDARCRLRFGTIRRGDLPQKETSGILTPLGIPLKAGLAEKIHVVFFENNIAGCDFNYYGPRITKLADYFPRKARGVAPKMLHFEPLLRHDAVERLARVGNIRLFKLKIRPSMLSVVRQANESLGKAFEAALRAGQAEEVEIILRPAPTSRNGLSKGLAPVISRLLGSPMLEDGATKFCIEGYNEAEERVKLDLLSDQLIVQRSILRQDSRTRALNQEAAYTAIEDAHEELKGEFPLAAEAIV
jgi:hypothetical protein